MLFVTRLLLLASMAITLGRAIMTGCPIYTVYIVIDGSESITAAKFQEVKFGLKDFIQESLVKSPKDEIGVIVFSDSVTSVITASNNAPSLLQAVDGIEYPSSGTRTDIGIKRARELLDASPTQNTKVMIVVTDGLSNLPTATNQEASLAKNQNITIFVAGVTSRVATVPSARALYMNELYTVASSNHSVFLYDTFISFSETFGDMTSQVFTKQPCKTLCPGPGPSEPLTTVDYTLVYILAGVCGFQFVLIIMGIVVFCLSRRRKESPDEAPGPAVPINHGGSDVSRRYDNIAADATTDDDIEGIHYYESIQDKAAKEYHSYLSLKL